MYSLRLITLKENIYNNYLQYYLQESNYVKGMQSIS